jgi:hypothetical protein
MKSNDSTIDHDNDDQLNMKSNDSTIDHENDELNMKSNDSTIDHDNDDQLNMKSNDSTIDHDNDDELNTLEKIQIDKFGNISGFFDEFSSRQSDFRGVLQIDEDSSEDDELVDFNPETYMEKLELKGCFDQDDDGNEDEDDQMDEEIRMHLNNQDCEEDDEVNLIKNIMASLEMQQGGSGPATTLFNNLGLKF